jgi:hypothetical protein
MLSRLRICLIFATLLGRIASAFAAKLLRRRMALPGMMLTINPAQSHNLQSSRG